MLGHRGVENFRAEVGSILVGFYSVNQAQNRRESFSNSLSHSLSFSLSFSYRIYEFRERIYQRPPGKYSSNAVFVALYFSIFFLFFFSTHMRNDLGGKLSDLTPFLFHVLYPPLPLSPQSTPDVRDMRLGRNFHIPRCYPAIDTFSDEKYGAINLSNFSLEIIF